MDPVLSSTVEFDEYIKSHLNISGAKVLSSRTGPTKDSNNLNYKHGRALATSSDAKDSRKSSVRDTVVFNESKDVSQDFLKMNIHKYHHAVPRNHQTSSNKDSRRDREEDVPVVDLKHSWKAHLAPPRKTDTDNRSRSSAENTDAPQRSPKETSKSTGSSSGAGTRTQSKLSYDDDWDLAWDNLKPPSPVSEVRGATTSRNARQPPPTTITSADSTKQANKYDNGNLQRAQLSVRPSNILNDSADADFGAYKVRLVLLKRCFATWNGNAQHSVEALMRRHRDVTENSVYWPKRSCFTWWHMLYAAAQQMKVGPVYNCFLLVI